MADKAALIVGAGDAIGAAILEKFAREGYAAVGVRRSPEKLGELIGRLTGEGLVAHAWQCDARKEEDVQATIARVEVEVGPLEVVVLRPELEVDLLVEDHLLLAGAGQLALGQHEQGVNLEGLDQELILAIRQSSQDGGQPVTLPMDPAAQTL